MTTFKITNTDYNTDDKFIFCVHWTAFKTDDDFTASIYNTISFTKEDGVNLIPYADLTEEIVIGWVKSALGEDTLTAINASLTANIEDQKVPKKATGTPWNK